MPEQIVYCQTPGCVYYFRCAVNATLPAICRACKMEPPALEWRIELIPLQLTVADRKFLRQMRIDPN